MGLKQGEDIFKAESDEQTVSELFSGKLSIEQALQKLRTRLLDLSARNRLLNFKHPKGRSIQFVDEPNLNQVFARLEEGKPIGIKYVPEPPSESYVTKRPEVKSYAALQGIDVNVDFSSTCVSSAKGGGAKLQALYYPAELDKLCRKLATEARTIIEETGTNMMYLVFGFLEFYDRDDSEKAMMAPLLAVPVSLEKGQVDPETRTYQYSLVYSGDDVHENQTLREKLSQDLSLQLPEYGEDDSPGEYLAKVQKAVQKKKRWSVHYQLTLGFLSFGKLAIWDDLDPGKWPSLTRHPLLKNIFSGGSSKGAGLVSEDYEIDKHPKGDLPVIYDADSSQHSAIIDVLAGKNMVINGPPGTGKSQTITNIIAAGLQAGKKILFVSEKLAALEVVRHRLNQANLGHFCLELHSHKSQKKKLLSDLQDRLDEKFRAPQQLQDKVSTLKRHKKQLNRYAELMSSRIGNELGLTVYEVFWKTEVRRQAIGELTQVVQTFFLPDARLWTFDEIEFRRTKLEAMGQIFDAIGSYDTSNPWWGFVPRPLAPGDENVIAQIVLKALDEAECLNRLVEEFTSNAHLSGEPSLESLLRLNQALLTLPLPPKELLTQLLPRVFSADDLLGRRNIKIISDVVERIRHARERAERANELLSSNCSVSHEDVAPIANAAVALLGQGVLSVPIEILQTNAAHAGEAFKKFERIRSNGSYEYSLIHPLTLLTLKDRIEAASPLSLLGTNVQNIRTGAERLLSEASHLESCFTRIAAIAKQRGIEFDGSPAAVAALAHPDGIKGVLPGVVVEQSTLAKAGELSGNTLAGATLTELEQARLALRAAADRISGLIDELGEYARQISLPFDGTEKTIGQLRVLAVVALEAPAELLDYRCASLAHSRVSELLDVAEKELEREKSERESLAESLYLDAIPPIEDLKGALRAFRRGDSFFNFLHSDWRTAKRLIAGISKSRKKRSASEYERLVSDILEWTAHRDSLINNDEFKEMFGRLFKGIDTDFTKIRRLHAWYLGSHEKMLKHPGLIDLIDLTALDPKKVSQLAALSSRIDAITSDLADSQAKVRVSLGEEFHVLESELTRFGWTGFKDAVTRTSDAVNESLSFLDKLVEPQISPRRAVHLLKAKLELREAKDDFHALIRSSETIRSQLEPLLPGVGSISCTYWPEYLRHLHKAGQAAHVLGETLSAFGKDALTTGDIRSFLEAKIELDVSVAKLSAQSFENRPADWNEYSASALKFIETASDLAGRLGHAADPEKTVHQVLLGLEARRNAEEIVSGIAKDVGVISILGDLYRGLETDVDSLAATLSWGESVATNDTVRNSGLHKVLLSVSGTQNFAWAKSLLGQVEALRNDVEETLNTLNTFGRFAWTDWMNINGLQTFSSALLKRMALVSSNTESVLPWAKYANERFECGKFGLSDFIAGLEGRTIPASSIGAVYEYVAYRSIGRSIYKSLPELEAFVGAKHEKGRSEFIALDKEIIDLTGKSFAYEINKTKKVPEGEAGYRVGDYTEMYLLHHELGKQKKHIPIRQLIKRAGRAIQALKPCFMMGPMSVAQYLEQGSVQFDLVVMDEASQLRPEEALGAIARSTQLVVVGDPKQLPPTNFFDRMVDGDDEEDDETPAILGGTESILDICQQLFHPVRTLRWHYRSQHESLIAFSNHHFYKGKLVVFPSPYDRNNRLGVRYRYVRNGSYKDRQNIPEANRVADAVIEHMMKYPGESLGVVTLNQTQRDLIEDLVDKKLRSIEEAQTFMARWEEDGLPFFVKNLENVQGDERDVIFISSTFGKAPGTNKVRQNFGPISRPDGWRRLNVLFTRARRKIELFTSMLPEDIVLDAKTPAGTQALKNYLDFAKRGILAATDITGREEDSDFEIAVGDMLRGKGYEIVPQLGVAGFFIDIAVRNPDRPGEFLAAVECDGATYHSSNSARDRDRIRQTILESLGWKDRIWRIWSTDWFYNPRRETERLLEFLEERRHVASLEPSPDYEFGDEPDEEDIEQAVPDDQIAVDDDVGLTSSEELFVEVGDRVIYCFADKPDEKNSVMIVDSDSNPKLNLVNENTALAQALLNCAVGDEPTLEIKGEASCKLRVLRIQRQEALHI